MGNINTNLNTRIQDQRSRFGSPCTKKKVRNLRGKDYQGAQYSKKAAKASTSENKKENYLLCLKKEH